MYSINGNYYNKVIENFTAGAKYNGALCESNEECISNFCIGTPKKCYNGASCVSADTGRCPSYSNCTTQTVTIQNGIVTSKYNDTQICYGPGSAPTGKDKKIPSREIYRPGTYSGGNIII